MTSRTKLWALSAGALALSLALAGCGGGGSSSSGVRTPSGSGGGKAVVQPAATAVSMADVNIGGTGYVAPEPTGDDPLEIEAGMSATSGSVTFTCAEGDDDCTVMVADDGAVTSTGGTVTAMNSETYQAALDNADALSKETALRAKVGELTPIAGTADTADSALMMAVKYAALIGTEKSDGDSMVAMNNAAAVLKAKADLKAAIDAAKEARTAAMEAKDALGEDGDADVIDTLEAAIEDADEKIEAAEDILDGTALAAEVEKVTGDDEDNLKTPEDARDAVAQAVALALGPTVPQGGTSTPGNGAGLRVAHSSTAATAPADDLTEITIGTNAAATVRAATNRVAKANKYEAISHDPDSMTWAMIVGEDNVEMKPLGTIDATGATFTPGNAELPVASLAGETASDVDKTATPLLTNGSSHLHGAALGVASVLGASPVPGIEYKGIPGRVICLGGDDGCSISSDGELSAGWYFSPVNPKAYWMKAASATVYTEDTMFATYGHWLVVDDSDDTTTANVDEEGQVYVLTYAYGPTGGSTEGWGEAAPGTTSSEQATYSGMAAGRSVHRVSDEDVNITETHSGRFTATVMLTAKFGSGAAGTDNAPMLGGRVTGFQSDNPNAVDSDWTVTLEETEVTSGAVTAGTAKASGQNGTWTATSYGGDDGDAAADPVEPVKRPVGIFGGFNAHFTDGSVAGAYATRKD